MSLKTRLNKLEKDTANNRIWAFIGIGKPQNPQHQRRLEAQARDNFYASGGDRNAYLAFLPFDAFGIGFIGYVAKSELSTMIIRQRTRQKVDGTPKLKKGKQTFRKVTSLSGTGYFLNKRKSSGERQGIISHES